MTSNRLYHIGFGREDLGASPPGIALLSGEPERARLIAQNYLHDTRLLSENRGLNSYIGRLPNGRLVLSATSGMGAPSLSIVVNELIQVGIRQIIRVGTAHPTLLVNHPADIIEWRLGLAGFWLIACGCFWNFWFIRRIKL